MNIWIDADTGTYGIADDLYIIKVPDDSGIGDLLDGLSDFEICVIGKAFGDRVLDKRY